MAGMSYLEQLQTKESILCIGLDPAVERIPIKDKDTETTITTFFTNILEAIKSENIPIGAVKPNIAFFEQYGFEGLRALKRVLELARQHTHIIILDAKRGDIGKSSAAYAKAVFNFWNADAVTVNPFLGSDSIRPFLEYCKKGKGVYILTKTSNPGSGEFQDPVRIADKINAWHTQGIGAVIGATFPSQLREITRIFRKPVPLLIPGIGRQGGSIEEVAAIVKGGGDIALHRISSSSGITYAYEKNNDDHVEAAIREIRALNSQIGRFIK